MEMHIISSCKTPVSDTAGGAFWRKRAGDGRKEEGRRGGKGKKGMKKQREKEEEEEQ